MSTPILTTKLYIPSARSNLVRRPRLIERLNEGLCSGRALSLISAPAGFGKTTLASSWLSRLAEEGGGSPSTRSGTPSTRSGTGVGEITPARVAWLSLEAGDNDPARFLAYLVAAVQTVAPGVGAAALAALHASQQPPPPESILTALLNDLTTLSHRLVLVLDDYHLIEAKAVDQALTFLLEHLPPQLHLVITTREDPQLPLARLRVRDQLTELRAADLRFTLAEAAAFLNQVMGLSLAPDDIAALEARTEGWIAGLQLAALSMRGQKDSRTFITTFTGSHRFVLDYLLEEVLHQQSGRVQAFLLQTSILDRLCGPLCDAVLGQGEFSPADQPASGQETLEYLDQANLFIVSLDNERRWYRYHHLFADLLRQRLQQNPPPLAARSPSMGETEGKIEAELHLRASTWYEANDWPIEAIRHALAAQDFARVARLAELLWPAMDGRFETATWLGWVQALPDELVRTRPVLSVGVAWAFLNGGEMEAGEAWLDDAERWLDPAAAVGQHPEDPAPGMVVVDEAQFQALQASIATARAYIAQAHDDVPGTVTYARRALDLLPEEDHIRRGVVAALLGMAYWASGELEAAHQSLADGMANFQVGGNLHFAISGTYGLADMRLAQGRLREAVKTYEQSLQLVAAQDEPAPAVRGTADLYLGLADLHREMGDLETAAEYLRRSQTLGEQTALPHWQYRVCVGQARLKESQGDLDGALDRLDQAERLYIRGPVPDVRPIAALKTRVWIRQGRWSEALAWARERHLSVEDDLSYMRECEHITLAKALITQSQHDRSDRPLLEAVRLLERLLKAAEEGGRIGSVIEILMLQALAHQAQGDISSALGPLERALSLAEPEGYVRLFVDEGPPLAELLAAAAAGGLAPRYTAKLLAAFPDFAARPTLPSASPATAPDSDLIEPLSERELEVLQLIAQGLSNREISERLFLALSTVKGHNRLIFGKLQVQRRTEAVARARELGLL